MIENITNYCCIKYKVGLDEDVELKLIYKYNLVHKHFKCGI